MQLSDFNYHLPQEVIAQEPISPRDCSKLLLACASKQISDHHFYDLPSLLTPGDLIIMNNSKVIKSRLQGFKNQRKIELFLNKPIQTNNVWHAFAKPARKINIGDHFNFGKHRISVIDKGDMGTVSLQFHLHDDVTLFDFLEQYGITPLPPYIKRNIEDARSDNDTQSYQTIYSQTQGSVAAPTAGLHFTETVLDQLRQRGVQIAYVTLHVGAGTFLPVKTENLAEHQMHSEFCEISQRTADAVNHALKNHNRIIAVGTTSLRTLESSALKEIPIKPGAFETDLFITPGFEFKIASGLITNFHLPKSTPLMLTSAFGGYEYIRQTYRHALDNNYRFCSYGDACLFLREKINEL